MLCNLPFTGYKYRRIYFLLGILLNYLSTNAQNKNNYLQTTTFNTTYNLTNNSSLETQQVRSNAFQITIVSKNFNNFNIYAKISSSTGPNGTGLSPALFLLRLNSVYPLLTASYNSIRLSNTDKLIQDVTTFWPFWNIYSTVTFNYDLILDPVGYDYQAGTYVTTFLFTMTQP